MRFVHGDIWYRGKTVKQVLQEMKNWRSSHGSEDLIIISIHQCKGGNACWNRINGITNELGLMNPARESTTVCNKDKTIQVIDDSATKHGFYISQSKNDYTGVCLTGHWDSNMRCVDELTAQEATLAQMQFKVAMQAAQRRMQEKQRAAEVTNDEGILAVEEPPKAALLQSKAKFLGHRWRPHIPHRYSAPHVHISAQDITNGALNALKHHTPIGAGMKAAARATMCAPSKWKCHPHQGNNAWNRLHSQINSALQRVKNTNGVRIETTYAYWESDLTRNEMIACYTFGYGSLQENVQKSGINRRATDYIVGRRNAGMPVSAVWFDWFEYDADHVRQQFQNMANSIYTRL